MKTLKDILLRAAESNNGLTYIWHRNEKQISYAELLQRAHLNLHHLRKYGISAGAEIILQIEDDLDFIVAFWACILGGFQVLLLPYANKQQAQDTIDSVVDMMKHPYVCISPDESNRTEYSRQHGYPIGTVIDICTADEWDEDIANRVTIHNSKPDDVAVIQFSSGSTGNPKGVCTTHANILPIAASVNLTDKDTTLCWLSLTHNLALLGFHIPATFAACNQIIMSTSYFLTNPLRWFSEVSRRKVTVTTSPNFGYKHFLNFYEKSMIGIYPH